MKKKTLLIVGCLLLVAGWLSAFVLNSIPQHSTLYIIGPTLLLGSGMGLTHKAVGGRKTAIALVFTAMAGLLLLNQLFPERSVSISAFKQRMRDGAKGKLISIEVKDQDRSGVFTIARQLEVFSDVTVQLFARLPASPAMMTFDSTGHLYVTIPSLGAVYRLTDDDSDGFADTTTLFYVGLDQPSGLVWQNKKLYVSQPDQLLELSSSNDSGQVDQVRVVAEGFPDDGGHWLRPLAAAADGHLYLSIGSRCNVCEEKNPLRGTVLKIDSSSGETVTFARGLRNTTGLTISPTDSTLWGSEMSRDGLGAQLPPDEINQIVADGDYGWPYCYGAKTVDPLLGSAAVCQETQSSQVNLPAHSAPMGIVFGDQLHAPKVYQDSLYVILHGRSDGRNRTPGKLIRIPYRKDRLADHGKEFIRGFGKGEAAWGQPTQVVVGTDGSLYVSDEKALAIYRISWKQKKE